MILLQYIIIYILLFLLLYFLFSKKKNENTKKEVKNIFLFGFLGILVYCLSIIFNKKIIKEIFYTLYLININLLLYFLSCYFMILTGKIKLEYNKSKAKKIQTYLKATCILDSLSLLVNLFTNHYFNFQFNNILNKNIIVIQNTSFYFFHISFVYFVIIYSIRILFYNFFSIKKFERKIRYLFLILLILVIFTNHLEYLRKTLFNCSIYVYSTIIIFIYYYSVYIKKAQNINIITKLYFESLNCAVFCFDYNQKCIYKNKIAFEILDNNENIDYISEEYIKRQEFEKCRKSDKEYIKFIDTIVVKEVKRYFSVEYKKLLNKNGVLIGSYLFLNDYTYEIEQEIKNNLRYTYDSLTGLLNKNGFFKKVKGIIEKNPDEPKYMIATNIKNFKFLNDVFGSELGDKILKKQAEMLSMAKYKDCVIGRISSDRFGMLINKKDFNQKKALENTENIKQITKSLNYNLQMYIGIYEISDPKEDVYTMYDKALIAIEKKSDGFDNLLKFYDTMIMDKKLHENNILNDFQYALDNNQFDIALQPIFDSKVSCVCVDALVRWNHPSRGIIMPSEFIPYLEKSNYITKLDIYVWKKAASFIKKWKDKGFQNVRVSVNISEKDFYFTDIYSELTEIVKKYGISPQQLKLEITENTIVNKDSSILETIKELKNCGFKIEIKNFGQGNCCLSIINEVAPDFIKVDMNALNINDYYNRSTILLKSIISLSKKIGIGVTVSKIESNTEIELISKLNCDRFQGYYFTQPFMCDDFDVNKYFITKVTEDKQ